MICFPISLLDFPPAPQLASSFQRLGLSYPIWETGQPQALEVLQYPSEGDEERSRVESQNRGSPKGAVKAPPIIIICHPGSSPRENGTCQVTATPRQVSCPQPKWELLAEPFPSEILQRPQVGYPAPEDPRWNLGSLVPGPPGIGAKLSPAISASLLDLSRKSHSWTPLPRLPGSQLCHLSNIRRLTLQFAWSCGHSPQTFRMAWPLPVVLRCFDLKLAEGLRSPGYLLSRDQRGKGGPEKECDLLKATPLRERRAGSRAPRPGLSCRKSCHLSREAVRINQDGSVRHLASLLAHSWCSRNG